VSLNSSPRLRTNAMTWGRLEALSCFTLPVVNNSLPHPDPDTKSHPHRCLDPLDIDLSFNTKGCLTSSNNGNSCGQQKRTSTYGLYSQFLARREDLNISARRGFHKETMLFLQLNN
jgi:hypothetical protein